MRDLRLRTPTCMMRPHSTSFLTCSPTEAEVLPISLATSRIARASFGLNAANTSEAAYDASTVMWSKSSESLSTWSG